MTNQPRGIRRYLLPTLAVAAALALSGCYYPYGPYYHPYAPAYGYGYGYHPYYYR